MAQSRRAPIYLDNHATTRLDPQVLEAMLPYLEEEFGNPSSLSHRFGWRAQEAVEKARAQVAALAGARPRDIVFTSGATESNNLALKGTAACRRERGKDHIVTVATEHEAVLDVCRTLERGGVRVTRLPVPSNGIIDPDAVRRALTSSTFIVSVMWVNNEIGTVNPIEDVARICGEAGVTFHCDAAQGFGKLPLDLERVPADLISLSAHKMYGPKGVGALIARREGPQQGLEAQIDGGGHERGLRSGSLNVPGIVGFGFAAKLAQSGLERERERVTQLRKRLYEGIVRRLGGVTLNGDPVSRHPGNLNLSFTGVEGPSLIMSLRGIAVSSGSACTSSQLEGSHVLRAIGVADDLARTSIRFGIGRFNTEEEIDYVIEEVVEQVSRLRAISGRD